MTMHDADFLAPGGERLTRLLAQWANARRLRAPDVEAIRCKVLAEPAPPGFDWWWRLLDPEHGQAFRGLEAAPGWWHLAEPAAPVMAPGVWSSGAMGPMGWPHEDGEYQPYLRLT
jgi:hypothetical protein